VDNVRQGKFIELDIDAASEDEARKSVEAMCDKLLANTVIENYRVEIV
jgi:phosphoribosylformylglycinamidine synthase PurS subunit